MWQLLLALIAYHELLCDDDQLLSQEVDRQRVGHPILIDLVITITALHLLRRLPQWVDPFYRVYLLSQFLKGNTWQPPKTLSPQLRQIRRTRRKRFHRKAWLLKRLTSPWAP